MKSRRLIEKMSPKYMNESNIQRNDCSVNYFEECSEEALEETYLDGLRLL